MVKHILCGVFFLGWLITAGFYHMADGQRRASVDALTIAADAVSDQILRQVEYSDVLRREIDEMRAHIQTLEPDSEFLKNRPALKTQEETLNPK